jgi:hypothetical protein
LEPKHSAKNVTGRLGAPCVLAFLCLCLSPATGLAQDSAGNTSTAKKTVATQGAPSKEHAKAAPSGPKASSTASTKAHPASHPSAIKHSKSSTSPATRSGKAKYATSRTSSKRKPRGQQKIDSERAEAIQEALIREHYMSGEPTGTWNQTSEDAMRRYQADHGWQSKQVPDSRALISLGLGPSNDQYQPGSHGRSGASYLTGSRRPSPTVARVERALLPAALGFLLPHRVSVCICFGLYRRKAQLQRP